eukprot:3933992-Rhodomonas_salina.3
MPRKSSDPHSVEDATNNRHSHNENFRLDGVMGPTERTSAMNIREAAMASGFTSAISVTVSPDEARADLQEAMQETIGSNFIPDLATRWKKIALPDGINQCENCGTLGEKLQICTGCKTTRYCGKACQLASWKRHKRFCAKSVKNTRDDRPIGTGNVVRDMMQDFAITMQSYAQKEVESVVFQEDGRIMGYALPDSGKFWEVFEEEGSAGAFYILVCRSKAQYMAFEAEIGWVEHTEDEMSKIERLFYGAVLGRMAYTTLTYDQAASRARVAET